VLQASADNLRGTKMNLKDKVIIVTGAASGIGRETAVAFADKEAVVVISDIDHDRLEETMEQLEQNKLGKFLAVTADVSKEEDVKRLIEKTTETYGRIDGACNNAGIGGELNTTSEYSTEEWDRVLNINLRGQWLCMKYQIREMLKQESGSIVNVASILGKVGFANAPAYVAAKHGLVGLTKTAALEYSSKGVRVNAVAPAFIETAMIERAGLLDDPEAKENLIKLHPIGRLGRPREVADAIVWLMSDEASFVTGHTMLVDGGYTVP
jgi:NAD(P)-dependent dehydrogenase (short-subunit alcohol dehydrogenase family)